MYGGVFMNRTKYLSRAIDNKVEEYLSVFGAVCIEGPKWCGKSWTAAFHANSEIYIADSRGNFQNRRLAEMSPETVLLGDTPRMIDEWQEVPSLWDAVRYKVDQSNQKGQYILTGSSTPNHKGILHSGAGRIGRLRMRPMSLYESGDSEGTVSLEKLCEGELTASAIREVSLNKIIDLIIRGGWPGSLKLSTKQAAILPKEYINAIIEDDVYRMQGPKRDRNKMKLLLRSLARNESTTATDRTLVSDIKAIDDEDIDRNTVAAYLDVFNRLFLLDNQQPFSSGIRSSVRVKQAEKHHFSDPSIACALLGATEKSLINDLETLGFLFEALCERDLKIYAETFGANVYHYQDYRNNEIDAVVELANGEWCAFEIKLGAHQIDDAAKNLIKIKKQFENDPKGKPPKVLGVICGLSNAAYQREDGVFVIPITSLKM